MSRFHFHRKIEYDVLRKTEKAVLIIYYHKSFRDIQKLIITFLSK
jgi:hypothetical protein